MMDIFTPKLLFFIEQALNGYEKMLEDVIELSCSEYETFYIIHFRFNAKNDMHEAKLLSAKHAVSKTDYEYINLPNERALSTDRIEWLEPNQDDKEFLAWQIQERQLKHQICAVFDIPESLLGDLDPLQYPERFETFKKQSG